VLLCQRNIEPCKGKWGYCQGFLELGETTRQGAAREMWEEAGVKCDPSKMDLLAIYNLAGMQIQMIYRVELENDTFEAGHESSDIKFVSWDEIPWDELAFPTVEWGLQHAMEMKDKETPVIQEKTKLVTMDGKWKVEEG
jgi:ADP-ribose pyrophosphatase YjhB (NUDIX family)